MYRSKSAQDCSPLINNQTDMLIKESQSLRNSTNMTDDAIETGILVNQRLLQQMDTMTRTTNTYSSILSKVPYIGELSSKIQIKRKKDRMILGSLIGFLMFFCVWYLFG